MPRELPNPTLVPFVIAMTGHRDIRPQDNDALRGAVREVFAELHNRMPSTPLLLMNGLAEGADQLVAEVALENNVGLVATLPMPVDIYREQMSETAVKTFDTLFAAATLTIQLPLEGRATEDIRNSEETRSWCYEALAQFLVRRSQVLLALWDGKDIRKRGGTAAVVHYARSRTLDPQEDYPSSCGVVYHVVTPRLSGDEPVPVIRRVMLHCEPRVSPAGGANPTSTTTHTKKHTKHQNPLALLESDLERFNRSSLALRPGEVEASYPLMDDKKVPLAPFLARLEALYKHADAISVRSNRQRRTVLLSILMIAVIGTIVYGVHGEMFGEQVWLWFSFPAFVIAALTLHYFARARHIEEMYLDSRALAEGLRVQFFWLMAGIQRPVDPYYLLNLRVEPGWVRVALRNVWLVGLHQTPDGTTLSAVEPNRAAVLQSWVHGQQVWYDGKAEHQAHVVHLREQVSRYGLIAAVLWSVLVPASILVQGPWHHLEPWLSLDQHAKDGPGRLIYACFHIALTVPALLAAAYKFWIEQAGYEEQSREYGYMQRRFARKAAELADHPAQPGQTEQLLVELGMEALEENGRWLLLHRERPLEVLSTP